MVIDHGAVPIFVKLLASPSDDVREQVLTLVNRIQICSSAFDFFHDVFLVCVFDIDTSFYWLLRLK